MREGLQNWLIVFSIISVIAVIIYFAIPQKEIEEEQRVLGIESVNLKNLPYIISEPSLSTKIGEEFEYQLMLSDLDTPQEELDVYLIEKPIWMYLSNDTVRGFPEEQGTYKFIVSVSDGENSTSQVNYLLVEGYE